ncbi:B-cell receptor CD22-like, partial [Gigantopelta aegis]|uniref:B-cell receptor CD22-like n=1 Tax=Gigantopelta aegis TaxID=1735272 RepID=UPI001B88DF20
TLIPVTTNDGSMCTSPQRKTFAVLTMNNKTGKGRVRVTVQLVHPSFENGVRNIQIGYAVFPVQVTMVTFLNTSSQNEKIGTSEGSITLICVTSPSNPAASISWYKNGQQINSGVTNTTEQKPDGLTVTTSSLSLTVYRSDDGYAVYCTAGIPGQTTPVISNTGILDVWYGPSQNGVIVEFSNSQAAVEGRSLTLKCSTNSAIKPNVDFTWQFSDGTEVIGSRGDKQGSSGNTWSQTLTLTPSKAENRQIVKCTVKNTATQTESTGQKDLEVKYPPSEAPAISGTGFPVFEGDVITLHCSTTGGNPKPTLTWSCPGGSTSCSNTDSGETRTCTISFTANRRQNNVDCVCTPSWQYGGYTESKSRKMIIHYAPDTPSLSSVPSQPWLEQRSASLNCSLTDQGNPVATFYWIRNNNGIEHTGFNYMFTPSKEDNRDEYKCTAGNLFTERIGQSRPESRPVQLNVYYSPRIQITLSTHDSRKEGDDLTLTCTADSNPSPSSLTWMFGGQTKGDDGSLRLTNLSREEHGQYTCEARVSAGRYGNLVNSSDFQVVVNYAPSVTFLSLNSTENNSSSIICSADGRPGNMNFRPFSHYWNSVNIRNVAGRSVGNNQYVLTFNRATYEDSGMYYCTVDNGVPDRSGTKQQTASSEVFIS